MFPRQARAQARHPRPRPIAESRLALAGYRTRALEVAGAGPLHIMLHGYADSADTWRQLLERFAADGRAAVALDLPGFATADPLREDEPVLVQLRDFALAALARFGAGREGAILVGNSLGASTALLAAAAEAERRPARSRARLRGVVPIAPAGFDMAGWIYRLETFAALALLLRAPLPIPAGVLAAIVGRAYRELAIHDQRAVSDELVAAFARHHRERAAALSYMRTATRMRPELLERFDLEAIRVPVLLLWGEHDRMLPRRNAELVLAQLPHAELELIDDCGHCPQVECPERVDDLLAGFAVRAGAGAPARRAFTS